MQEILSAVDAELFGVWFLIGAALVFWMQAGFAMVEIGCFSTRHRTSIPTSVRSALGQPFISPYLRCHLIDLIRSAIFIIARRQNIIIAHDTQGVCCSGFTH